MIKDLIFGLVFLLIGLGLIFVALYQYNNEIMFVRKALKAEGTIVDYAKSSGPRYPIIEFYDKNKKDIIFGSRTPNTPLGFSVGDKVTVLYNPSSSENAKISSRTINWGMIIGVGGSMGVPFFLIGLYLIVSRIFKPKKKKTGRRKKNNNHGKDIKIRPDGKMSLTVPFTRKLIFFYYGIKENFGFIGVFLAIILVSFSLGLSFWFMSGGDIVAIIIPAVIIVLCLGFGLYTVPSSVMYFYEKALAEEYSDNITAIVTNKRIEDYSHTNSNNNYIEEFVYFVEYKYIYNKNYESEFDTGNKKLYDEVKIGAEIPIRVLMTKPEISYLRKNKLRSMLSISVKE